MADEAAATPLRPSLEVRGAAGDLVPGGRRPGPLSAPVSGASRGSGAAGPAPGARVSQEAAGESDPGGRRPGPLSAPVSGASRGSGAAEPASSEEGAPVFMELFAGAGGLTAAVVRAGLAARRAEDIVGADGDAGRHFDLRRNEVFKRLRSDLRRGNIRWLHGAPPCKTFSRARRPGRWGPLRTAEYPGGRAAVDRPCYRRQLVGAAHGPTR